MDGSIYMQVAENNNAIPLYILHIYAVDWPLYIFDLYVKK
jgi:hypothetical protein